VLGQGHQQGRAGGAGAETDGKESEQAHGNARGEVRGGNRGAQGRGDTAGREHQHAADDPSRGAPADIRAVAEARPQHLHRVVQRHEESRQHGRQRQLDHHDPVKGGGREYDDRTEAGLHQAQAHDGEPAQAGGAHATTTPPRTANALTIIPST
jgi:hypothetical protein